MTTNVREFFSDLDGGVFEQKLSAVLSDVGAAVIEHNANGKIVLTIEMKRIGNSYQLHLDHTLTYTRPTVRGERREKDHTVTLMHFGKTGITLFPEDQGQLFGKRGDVLAPTNNKQEG